MTDARKDGGPAFPTEPNTQPGVYVHHGMTLRDWFAGQALTGRMLNGHASVSDASVHARVAYAMADAMLLERSK